MMSSNPWRPEQQCGTAPGAGPKLVRHGIPALAKQHGHGMTVELVEGRALLGMLGDKTFEEALEVRDAIIELLEGDTDATRQHVLDEAADVWDALREIVWAAGFSLNDLQEAQQRKKAARGPLVDSRGRGLLWTGDPAEQW